MLNELNALESKVVLVASLCRALRAENAQLRLQLSVVENDKKKLTERMESARDRLEQLASQLPQAKTALAKQA
jgi:chromosome segregation ATPase